MERHDHHFQVKQGLVDVGGFPQGLPGGARLVRALRPRQVHQVQLRATHLKYAWVRAFSVCEACTIEHLLKDSHEGRNALSLTHYCAHQEEKEARDVRAYRVASARPGLHKHRKQAVAAARGQIHGGFSNRAVGVAEKQEVQRFFLLGTHKKWRTCLNLADRT